MPVAVYLKFHSGVFVFLSHRCFSCLLRTWSVSKRKGKTCWISVSTFILFVLKFAVSSLLCMVAGRKAPEGCCGFMEGGSGTSTAAPLKVLSLFLGDGGVQQPPWLFPDKTIILKEVPVLIRCWDTTTLIFSVYVADRELCILPSGIWCHLKRR